MGALPQALEIILEVQMKMSNEKIAKKKKKKKKKILKKKKKNFFLYLEVTNFKKLSFSTHKTRLFSSLWTSPTFKASNFVRCFGHTLIPWQL